MNEYVTDEEQVERIKIWWNENGNSVIAGLVIGVGGLLGWRYWVDYKNTVAAEASAHFSQMIKLVESKKSEQAINEARIILDDYSNTAYSDLARLSLAKVMVDSAKYDEAQQHLQWLVDSASDSVIEMTARKRLALVYMQLQQFDKALDTLAVDYPSQFAAGFEETKGDILAAKGDIDKAREAYQKAKLAQPQVPNPQFLQQKLDDLGSSGVKS